ncbi:CARS2 [Bugula neritina]|uniref:CARS2 n=1 Tax=Bugula neritina TaxID=10212 RepID=A0A7J7JYE6_BUGNE|nr:CARS2 [Bugula neritina]
MRKPVKILKKLAALRSMALLHIQGEGTSAMVNNEMLMQSLMSTQKVVRSALADNFDTQQMMSALMSLVHICNIELCKPSNKNEVKAREVYSIAAVTSYIDTLMSQLGVNHTSQHAEHADSAASSQSLEDIMNSVTHFREKVRNFSLGGNTANASVEEKSRIKNHRKSHSVLLDSSDQLRDELATLAGIIIKDTTDGKSHWHMIDKASGEVDTES